jgi:hypothetical protein
MSSAKLQMPWMRVDVNSVLSVGPEALVREGSLVYVEPVLQFLLFGDFRQLNQGCYAN